jgi:hypothetical protein
MQIGVVLAAMAGIALFIAIHSPVTRSQSSTTVSMAVRWEMTKIGLHLTAQNPIFGIGLGRFRLSSRSLIPADLRAIFPQTQNGENAHNNFVQILAELGGVGLFAFLWLLAAAGSAVAASRRAGRANAAIVGFAGGLLAFLLSCLAGHPLLIPEILLLFFLALGLAAGLAAAPNLGTRQPRNVGTQERRNSGTTLTIAIIAVVITSLPIRVWQLRQKIDLTEVVIGASAVAGKDNGLAYRIAESRSRWYVASAIRHVQIPLRLADESASPCLVQVSVDGKLANRLEPSRAGWIDADLPLESGRRTPASRAVELQVIGEGCRLMVGNFRTRN